MATAPLRSGIAETSSSRRVPGSPPWYRVGPWFEDFESFEIRTERPPEPSFEGEMSAMGLL